MAREDEEEKMKYEQALEASKCDPQGVMNVLKDLEVECPECKGSGINDSSLDVDLYNPCTDCNGTGKISYSWTPQVGEWCIHKPSKSKNLLLIIDKSEAIEYPTKAHFHYDFPKHSFIPILPWETIEEILKKAGYKIWFPAQGEVCDKNRYEFRIIDHAGNLFNSSADTRQEAVMKAILELGKEMK